MGTCMGTSRRRLCFFVYDSGVGAKTAIVSMRVFVWFCANASMSVYVTRWNGFFNLLVPIKLAALQLRLQLSEFVQ